MRTKPVYDWSKHFTKGEPLKGEKHTHVMRGSSKRPPKRVGGNSGPTLLAPSPKSRGGGLRASQSGYRTREEAEYLFNQMCKEI